VLAFYHVQLLGFRTLKKVSFGAWGVILSLRFEHTDGLTDRISSPTEVSELKRLALSVANRLLDFLRIFQALLPPQKEVDMQNL
jgi:hypothetical protein